MALGNKKKLLFFDESRFGTHSRVGHGWYKTGERSRVKIKLGYENFYLYGAVDPFEGVHHSLILPSVNTDGMNVYLNFLSVQYPEDEIILVVDGAGWHKSKELIIPSNIKLFYLPPYSPELNPIERLWLYIKQNVLRNKVFESIDSLEKQLSAFIVSMTPQIIAQVCAINYMDI